MSFQLIDLDNYLRREHYEQFLAMKLTYSATVNIDITGLRSAAKGLGYRIYPAQIWILTTAANRVPEFRMSRDSAGHLGIWDELSPHYTVFEPTTHTFSGLWTAYRTDFGAFYHACVQDIERFGAGSLAPQAEMPGNLLNVSSIPWVAFTSFNLNLPDDDLLPILTIGKHAERDGRIIMPLAIQVHHAVCDGWHLGQYVEQVQAITDDVGTWIG